MNQGMSFQNTLDNIFLNYRLKKIGIVQRIELPAIMTKHGITIERSTVDYFGHYKGFPVAFDAKECKSKRLNIKTNLKQHQIEFLDYWKKSSLLQNKVLAGFFISFYELDIMNTYFYDIDAVIKDIANNKKSISMEEIPLKLPLNETLLERYFQC